MSGQAPTSLGAANRRRIGQSHEHLHDDPARTESALLAAQHPVATQAATVLPSNMQR
jgi:hypothetical protein